MRSPRRTRCARRPGIRGPQLDVRAREAALDGDDRRDGVSLRVIGEAALTPTSASQALKRSQAPGSAGTHVDVLQHGLDAALEPPALGLELREQIDRPAREFRQLRLGLDERVQLGDAQPDQVEASLERERAREQIGRHLQLHLAAAAHDALGVDRRGAIVGELLPRREVSRREIEAMNPQLGVTRLRGITKQELSAPDVDPVDLERRDLLEKLRREIGSPLGLWRRRLPGCATTMTLGSSRCTRATSSP